MADARHRQAVNEVLRRNAVKVTSHANRI